MEANFYDVMNREQNPEDRPTFTSIVDELLELEKEIPDAKYSDVSRSRALQFVLFFKLTISPSCNLTQNVKESVGDILDGIMRK